MPLTRTSTILNPNTLLGEVESITMMELRRNPGEVMDQVTLGKVFTITRGGKVVATLTRTNTELTKKRKGTK